MSSKAGRRAEARKKVVEEDLSEESQDKWKGKTLTEMLEEGLKKEREERERKDNGKKVSWKENLKVNLVKFYKIPKCAH